MKEALPGPRLRPRPRRSRSTARRPARPTSSACPSAYDWAADYRGHATVVYGHTPVAEPAWLNNTINIDTGCVFGGRLTALRWPERELVSVPAARDVLRARRSRSLAPRRAAVRRAALLDLDDVAGKRIVQTRLARTVTVREENAAAALEVMSRFAVDPRWLVYLPPTMSPTATSAARRAARAPRRGVRLLPRRGRRARSSARRSTWARARSSSSAATPRRARQRFGVDDGSRRRSTRAPAARSSTTPRPSARSWTASAPPSTAAGLWDELETDWLVLDCELLPWSAKAQELMRPPVRARRRGRHRRAATRASPMLERRGRARRSTSAELLDRTRERRRARATATSTAYRRYCWPVDGVDDLRLAPFHVLAGESGALRRPRPRLAPRALRRARRRRPRLAPRTDRRVVDLTDPDSRGGRDRVVGDADRRRRRGHGGQAARLRRPRPQGPRAARHQVSAAASTCASSTAPSTTRPTSSTACARAASAASARSRSREFALGIEALERFVRARAAVPRPRVRLRGARAGERAGRPAAVSLPSLRAATRHPGTRALAWSTTG